MDGWFSVVIVNSAKWNKHAAPVCLFGNTLLCQRVLCIYGVLMNMDNLGAICYKYFSSAGKSSPYDTHGAAQYNTNQYEELT